MITRLDELAVLVQFEQPLACVHTATAADRGIERERASCTIFHKALQHQASKLLG